jgi:chromosome segregation ATPase
LVRRGPYDREIQKFRNEYNDAKRRYKEASRRLKGMRRDDPAYNFTKKEMESARDMMQYNQEEMERYEELNRQPNRSPSPGAAGAGTGIRKGKP